MIALLADHNIEGHAKLLLSTLQSLGWVDLLELRLTLFSEVGLAHNSSDREVWHRAQNLGMLLLTDNRNNDGPGSLEQTILDDATSMSLPVVTVSNAERLRKDQGYRSACAEALVRNGWWR